MNDLNFVDLVNNGLIPSNASSVVPEAISAKCTPLSVVLSQDVGSRKISNVIIDNPIWVLFCKGFGMYSCDGEFVYNYNGGTKEFTRCLVRDKLIPIQTINLLKDTVGFNVDKNENQEDLKMDNSLEKLLGDEGITGGAEETKEAVKGALSDLLGDADMPVVGESNKFSALMGEESEDDKVLKEKLKTAKREHLEKAISATTDGVEMADLLELRIYNEKYAEFIGWLTASDAKNRAFLSSKKVIDEETKKPAFRPNLHSSVIQEYHRTGKGDKDLFLYNTDLKIKQNAPGPLKFGVLKIPANGIVKIEDIISGGAIKIDQTKKDMVLQFLPKDPLVTFVNMYIGDSIKESPLTHEEPGHLIVTRVARVVTDKDGNEKNRISPRIKSNSSKTLLQPKNYFPLSVNETVKVSDIGSLSKEKLNDLNEAFFGAIFKNESSGYGYNNLSAEVKALVKKEGDVITSSYLDPKARKALPIVGWYTKESIPNPEIPVKVISEKNGKRTSQFVKYDVLKPNSDLEHLNPFNNPKFEAFRKACGEGFNQTMLIETLSPLMEKAKSTGGKGETIVLSNDQSTKIAIELLKSSQDKGISGLDLAKGFDKSSMEALNKQILKTVL